MAVRLPSYSKIDFLVDRKFPTYRESLRFFERRHPVIEPEVEEMHKAIIRKAERYQDELNSMSEEEVSKLYGPERKLYEFEREQEEREQFYNQPILADDRIFWVKKLIWSLEEAVALSLDRNPREVSWDLINEFLPQSWFVKQYDYRRKTVLDAEKVGHLKNPIEPDKYVRWCFTEQIDLPDKLVRLVEEKYSRLPGPIEDVSDNVDTIDQSPEVNPEKQGPDNEHKFLPTGDHWSVTYQGQTKTIKNHKGIRYIAYLIENQGKEISVTELHNAINPPRSQTVDPKHSDLTDENLERMGLSVGDLGDAGDLLTPEGMGRLRKGVSQLQARIDEAASMGDEDKQASLEQQKEEILDYIATETGLGGKPRKASSHIERLRKAVTRRIRADIQKLEESFPALGHHFDQAIKTGTHCQYAPHSKIKWIIRTK